MINAYDKGNQKSFVIEGSETPQTVPVWMWIIILVIAAWGAYYGITSVSYTHLDVYKRQDYAMNQRMDVWRNTANLLGSERTGPDLTNIGERQPSVDWQLLHLYQPRAVVEQSVMPAYQWLFKEKDYLEKGDVEVKVPEKFLQNKFKKVVATKDAINLVAYLLSLKQLKLPDGTTPPEFLYKQKEKAAATGGGTALPDGGEIYNGNCVACHQANGDALPGAFPHLKASPIVLAAAFPFSVPRCMPGSPPHTTSPLEMSPRQV